VVCCYNPGCTRTQTCSLSLHDALPICDINPRFATIGGTEVTHSTGPLEVLGAVQRESSVRTRMALWQASLAMFADRPVVGVGWRSEEHTSELQSRENLVCRLLLEKRKR